MTDYQKLKSLLNERGLCKPSGSIDYRKISEITGHSYDSVKTMLQTNRDIPRWAKLILYVFDSGEKENGI